jgi:hypothetical protein
LDGRQQSVVSNGLRSLLLLDGKTDFLTNELRMLQYKEGVDTFKEWAEDFTEEMKEAIFFGPSNRSSSQGGNHPARS